MKAILIVLILALVAICACAPKPVVSDSNDSVCELCEYFVFELESMVNKSKPEIEKKLVQICEGLDKEYRSMCDTMVLLYGPKIIDYILKKEDPKTLCKQFHLCPAKLVAPKLENVGDVPCQLCTYVVQMAEEFVSKNQTIQEVEAELHKICEQLPTVFGQTCNNLVDEYIPYIVYYLKQRYPPQKVCEILKLCTAKVEEPKNDGVECFLCVKLVEMAEKYLESNKTEEEIEKILDKVCDSAPFGKKDYCKALVHQYLPYMIHFLEQKFPPKKVCEMMNICPKQVYTCDNGLEKCPTCMIVIEAAEKLIGEVVTKQEVEKALEKVCDKVNPKIQGQCKIIVDQFAMPIIEQIVKRATPSTICKLIKMCN